ncbi:hypothetical protein G2912_14040 [Paraburkholderia aspalathi]|uniref:Uncharacterized protein n=1 Tax=Paraburkholderia nemoris TaxID=2793076 RepID=A0ABN7LQT0_9BURK|nr:MULTISPECIES: hypothetical protein [Paraburkholderia]MBK3811474.1 hypothetical protein [Paraburkholderia aspalathi]CAE6761115.1 hypothetical protein R69776_03377 [Paraburkholderia nemoris]
MNTLPTVRVFAPEYWGELDKFKQFYSTTHDFNSDTKKAVSGIKGHFDKALKLHALAAKLAPNMSIDNAELQERGATSAANSQEVSAVLEEVFTELYSSIDCASKIVSSIYKRCRHMPGGSTRKLFARAAQGGVGDFPADLQAAFVSAAWYDELRMLRDELTHSDVGSCRLTQDGKISYMHTGVRRDNNALVLPDVFAKLDELFVGVNLFLGKVFHFLNQGLRAEPIDALCCFSRGRVYVRKLTIAAHIDFDSGVCQSRQWFDQQPDFRCIFASNCGAYARAAEAF